MAAAGGGVGQVVGDHLVGVDAPAGRQGPGRVADHPLGEGHGVRRAGEAQVGAARPGPWRRRHGPPGRPAGGFGSGGPGHRPGP